MCLRAEAEALRAGVEALCRANEGAEVALKAQRAVIDSLRERLQLATDTLELIYEMADCEKAREMSKNALPRERHRISEQPLPAAPLVERPRRP